MSTENGGTVENGQGSTEREQQFWLMKAEPDSRIVKGKDVAFSVDHFEKLGTSHWDGVRNALAKRYMKDDMKTGDRVLFYHSNTKIPGVAALAEVVKEGYPDHTAWDADHPYYDPKSDSENPKWYMVDVAFRERVAHFVPLALYKALAELDTLPEGLNYLTAEHLAAIKEMPLINRGRLSVQPVSKLAFEATILLGRNGGFEAVLQSPKGKKPSKKGDKRKSGSTAQGEDATTDETAEKAEAAPPSKRPKRQPKA